MPLPRVADRRHAALVGRELLGRRLLRTDQVESRTLNAPNPAPKPIMMRMGTQPCIASLIPCPACECFLKRVASATGDPGAATARALGPRPSKPRMLSQRINGSRIARRPRSARARAWLVVAAPLTQDRACDHGGSRRLAWFSPDAAGPLRRRGLQRRSRRRAVAAFEIDVFVDEPVARLARGARSAHDFIWRHRQRPYDLTVYQMGNSSHHDYLWPYLFRFPGPDRAARRAPAPRARGRAAARAGAQPTTASSSAGNHPGRGPESRRSSPSPASIRTCTTRGR